ncbi:unnamed protein product [Notodromas monacha]|uniref:Uncharacterized protein n=1 Tax=Notodromas monacha TaxID=399045 RepID=A0A7R9BHD5_9CRUS|nr:unnamed protein product [Notodromas monacha]CAG0915259.1 unnamed protein product [Notodromas monacha]
MIYVPFDLSCAITGRENPSPGPMNNSLVFRDLFADSVWRLESSRTKDLRRESGRRPVLRTGSVLVRVSTTTATRTTTTTTTREKEEEEIISVIELGAINLPASVLEIVQCSALDNGQNV